MSGQRVNNTLKRSLVAPRAMTGVHSLDHFAFEVPELSEAKRFFVAFGLDVREEGEALGLYTFGSEHRWGLVRVGPRKKLLYISFGAFDEHLPAMRSRIMQLCVKTARPPVGIETDGVWCEDPSGALLEIRAAQKSSPDEQSPAAITQSSPGTRGSSNRAAAPVVRPTRLAHILIFSTDVLRDIAFYESVLGLRLSDRAGDGIAFLHGAYGSDHHMIALAKSHKTGLHHTSWTVESVDEIGVGAMRMHELGYRNGWGFGRHVLGSNYFHYVRDPWNSYAEYSFGIDYVPIGTAWPAGDHPPEDAFYVWGPDPPADFGTNHE